jgi:hypothetical protein
MSGPLRQGFYDLLIALHLESHATTMEVCKNEYIIPLGECSRFREFFLCEKIQKVIKLLEDINTARLKLWKYLINLDYIAFDFPCRLRLRFC